MNLIRFNLKIRYRDNTLFKNLSRKFIQSKYLTNLSELNVELLSKDEVKMIQFMYNDVINNTIYWLNKQNNYKDFIQCIKNNEYENYYCNVACKDIFKEPLTRQHVIESIFQKGIFRIEFFYYFIDGMTIENDELQNWDRLTNKQKNILSMEFVITNQIFGDGNHRTSKFLKKYYEIHISKKDINQIMTYITTKKYNNITDNKYLITHHLENKSYIDLKNTFYKSWGSIIDNTLNTK